MILICITYGNIAEIERKMVINQYLFNNYSTCLPLIIIETYHSSKSFDIFPYFICGLKSSIEEKIKLIKVKFNNPSHQDKVDTVS